MGLLSQTYTHSHILRLVSRRSRHPEPKQHTPLGRTDTPHHTPHSRDRRDRVGQEPRRHRRYESEPQGQYTKQHLPTLTHIKKLNSITNTSFTLTQALTGHSYTRHYLHRFKIAEDDTCPCDGTTSQTMDHIIQHCPRFAALRLDHQILCNNLDVSPFRMESLLKHERAVSSFAKLADSILKRLKHFNGLI
ncbi:unnamed protein product [Euphydryas editha]|uniref:Reverse transcriptase n=1 Tax=Euphydryas editha TaxID=104508 RepID=A0AAU9TNR3_EUPED|nr:unnamed protein product [Euphydryas editha]